ncbi:MAG: sulfotransferase, partial [Anaerolineales bacterium]
ASRYLFELGRNNTGIINRHDVGRALCRCLPETRIVGYKFPNYVYEFGNLSEIEDLSIVMIYRDPRDVVSSTLSMVEKSDHDWTKHYDNAEKTSKHWLKAVESMEQYVGKIFCIKYENLINYPQEAASELDEYNNIGSV